MTNLEREDVSMLCGFIKTGMLKKVKPANKLIVFVTESICFLDLFFFFFVKTVKLTF